MAEPDFIRDTVHQALPAAIVHPTDMTGTGDHWHVEVIDPAFDGLRPLARQRLVMEPFKELLRTDVVHALDLVCLTPDEKRAREDPAPA